MRGVVYKYTSPSGKVYIGQTCRERKRRNEFLRKEGRYTKGSFIEEARILPPPSFKGQHLTQKMKDNISKINSKAVCQLDPITLEVIAMHKSCQAAANALGHPRSNSDIGKMCNGKTTKDKVLGYKWKWLNQ